MPRFYLRHFTDKCGQLCVYRRSNNSFFRTSPENVCMENNLYEVGDGDTASTGKKAGFLANYIENQLSEAEGRLAPYIEQLLDCCQNHDFSGDAFHEGRLSACILAANLIVRHPHMLNNERSGTSELTNAFLSKHKLTEHERWMLDQIGVGDNFDEVSELSIMQTLMFSDNPNVPFNRIYNAFADKDMTILEAPVGMAFITSCLPLYFVDINEEAYDFDIAYMPLSSNYAALFSTNMVAPRYGRLSIDEVVSFNAELLACNDLWESAMAHANGTLKAAVQQWRELERLG